MKKRLVFLHNYLPLLPLIYVMARIVLEILKAICYRQLILKHLPDTGSEFDMALWYVVIGSRYVILYLFEVAFFAAIIWLAVTITGIRKYKEDFVICNRSVWTVIIAVIFQLAILVLLHH